MTGATARPEFGDKIVEEVDYLIEVSHHTVLIYKMTDHYLA